VTGDVPSPRQLDVLRYLVLAARLGESPTYREIGDALGIASTNGVADHVQALVRKRLVSLAGRQRAARRIRLTRAGRAAVREAGREA